MAVKSHELARQLLRGENFPVRASIDISTCDDDSGRRIFSTDCMGVNNINGDGGEITILFEADPVDNYKNEI